MYYTHYTLLHTTPYYVLHTLHLPIYYTHYTLLCTTHTTPYYTLHLTMYYTLHRPMYHTHTTLDYVSHVSSSSSLWDQSGDIRWRCLPPTLMLLAGDVGAINNLIFRNNACSYCRFMKIITNYGSFCLSFSAFSFLGKHNKSPSEKQSAGLSAVQSIPTPSVERAHRGY
ncbi:hypothetical protein GDO81_017510 [Engystomops pustulosus]|uniref:Uncharacterized protein n=1 Tax=Engystomops pustulosus TaxID=76066 RepID=A0AAV7AKJ5_ENGPU|nr:hypothetical protein GDO81_017510 [Engystomops pustulosus]